MEHCYLLLRCVGWVVRESTEAAARASTGSARTDLGSARTVVARPEKPQARRETVEVVAGADRAGAQSLPEDSRVHVRLAVEVPASV